MFKKYNTFLVIYNFKGKNCGELLLFQWIFSSDFVDNELVLFCETVRMQKIIGGRPSFKQGRIRR
jgi:hypothetical protein